MKNIFHIIILSSGILLSQTIEQIKQAKEVIQRTKISKSQAKDAAISQGYTEKQIDNIIKKEEASKNKSGQSFSEPSEKIDLPRIGKSNELVQKQTELRGMENIAAEDLPLLSEDNLEIVEELDLSIDTKEQSGQQDMTFFGYDIFARDPALFQATSVGIVDPDYLIGPGDEIIVMLWGETQFRQVLQVDREGFVFIPEIGQVFVNGLNLNLLESKLFRVFSQSYASLSPQNRTPTTFLDVSLGKLRPLRIQVLGEVAQPGAYTVSPSATLFSALYYFNGPTTLGSLRDIQLIRGGKKIASIDFYDYLLTGKKPKDQKLQLDDIIFIPRRLKTVTIEGEINRGGIYELKPKETLTDLITMAGDLKITAYLDRAQIDRIVPFEKRAELGMDRMYTDVNLEQFLKSEDQFLLQEGDHIQIFSVLDIRQNIVDVRGAVTRPGSYDIGDSLKLSELINNADGILGDAYLERVDIVRIKPDFTEQIIKLDLRKALEGDPDNDIALQGLDRVQVYGMTEMVARTYVSITGHVKRPGRFLLQENMTLYDLIFKAGDFVDSEYKKLTYLKRAELVRVREGSGDKEIISFNLGQVLDKKGMADNILRVDDAVRIYSIAEVEGATRYVSISGHVKRSGLYELYEENMRIYDLLFKAGGFDDPDFRALAFLDRADLVRYDEDRITQTIIPFHLGKVLANKNDKHNFRLNPGDEIRTYSQAVFNSVRMVSINGVIRNPGNYSLKTGMTIKDLVLEAGGVTEDIYKYKIEVGRINPENLDENIFAEVIELEMLNDYTISNIEYQVESSSRSVLIDRDEFLLEPYDYISVRPNPLFKMQRKVSIVGAVYYPGIYTIMSPDENIFDIIKRAGGLTPDSYAFGSSFSRRGQEVKLDIQKIIKNQRSKSNIEVQDGDEINIALKPQIIQVVGEVSAPGFYKFQSRSRIKDMIKRAGGFSQNAEIDDISIRYPNGISLKYNRWFNNRKVKDGSIITVGRKREEEPFDRTEFAKELTAIIANLAQAITIVVLALR